MSKPSWPMSVATHSANASANRNNLPGVSLAADSLAELRLDHVEGAFDVRTLVVVPHEKLLVVLIPKKHPVLGAFRWAGICFVGLKAGETSRAGGWAD
jgi:hypothetical protein